MSVLQFSRKSEVIAEEPPVVEIEKPIPLKTRTVEALKPSKLPKIIRNYLIVAFVVLAVLAYPIMIFQSNKIGDELSFPESINQNWSSPWAGVGTKLLEREVDKNGWVPGAHAWMPQSRLTAMPVYQNSIAYAIGDFAELVNYQIGGDSDSDLNTIALLLSQDITTDEIYAAIEGLSSYDGGVRLHRYNDTLTAQRYAERVSLMASWLRQSSSELSSIVNAEDRKTFDRAATEAVYRAKARAYMAHRFLSFMQAPVGLSIKNEHSDALVQLEKVARFSPLFVVNGNADGMLFSSHPATLNHFVDGAEAELQKVVKTVEAQY